MSRSVQMVFMPEVHIRPNHNTVTVLLVSLMQGGRAAVKAFLSTADV